MHLFVLFYSISAIPLGTRRKAKAFFSEQYLRYVYQVSVSSTIYFNRSTDKLAVSDDWAQVGDG